MTAADWRSSSRRVVILSSILLLAVAAGLSLHVWRQADRAVQDGAKVAAAASSLPATITSLTAVSTRFEAVLPAMHFRFAAAYEGDLFVIDEGSLMRWSAGECRQVWRTGRELPAAPLVSLATRTGVGKPELWIATDGAGILIFDGQAIRQLLPTASGARKITALLPLRNGQVLAGTSGAGLLVTDGSIVRLFHQTLSEVKVTALAGEEDDFWVGTRDDGAWHWRGGETAHVKSHLPDQQVLSLAASGSTAWIGTALGVAEFTDGKWKRQLGPGLFAQALGKDGNALWVATIDQGTICIPLAEQSLRPRRTGLTAAVPAQTMSFVNLNGALAGVQAQQISLLQDRRVVLSALEGRLSGRHITAVHADGQDKLWVGYFDSGVDIVRRSDGVVKIEHFDDDRLFCVNRIKQDSQNGDVAVAAANGLALFDATGQMRRVLDRSSGLIASHVTDVLFTGGTTVAATSAGISFLENGISSLYGFQGLVNNHVYTLAEWDNKLYAGTLGGLSTVKRGLVEASFTTANSELKQNWITASQTFAGKLYLGTYGGGVVRVEASGSFTTYEGFAHKKVEINPNAMAASSKALYAGTAGYGLAVLPTGEERWRFITSGLPSANVTALDTHNGRLYVGTDNGLLQIEEASVLP